ncbi:MAG: serine/threonine-protein kinase, partial [Myxococcota bacterium]
AVVAAHRRGILHGALSPSGVHLVPGGLCRVDDWGLRLLEKRMATQTGGPESTFAYRSPELNLGRSADARADLYSIAAILFRCLRGSAPALGQGGLGWEEWPEPFATFFSSALAPDEALRPPSSDLFRRQLMALPWNQVAERRLTPIQRPSKDSATSDAGPRFVTAPSASPDAQWVTARDTLLHRNVRLFRLPPKEERPLHLIDRLHVLASPESPVFQDILRHDEQEGVIVLEVLREPPLTESTLHTMKPLQLLRHAAPLLRALADAHSQNIGLGTVTPDHARFDGQRLRILTEDALLRQVEDNAEAQIADNYGFWSLLLTALGQHRPDLQATPQDLLDLLVKHQQIASSDHQRLLGEAPDPNTSLSQAPDWFDDLLLTIETHLSRRRIFTRLSQLAHANRSLSLRERDFLEQQRTALGLD